MSEMTLRERKRLAAMRRIQETAFDLFEREGYDAVTIEHIAEQAEVSPSSVYRYFGTKEQLVLWDEYDPAAFRLFAEEVQRQPPLEAFRRAVTSVGEEFFGPDREHVERMVRFALEEPAITGAMSRQIDAAGNAIAHIVGEALDRNPMELEVQVFARSVVCALETALRTWHAEGFEPPLVELIDRAISVLADGLDL